ALSDLWLQQKRPEGERDQGVMRAARALFDESAAALAAALRGRPYLLGERFSVADVLNGSMVVLADMMGLLGGHPQLAEYAARIRSRPAFARS
ncbi:MAG TPA: glutathione S-transferase C-terminal domain-containing protein, partial [Polyangiaceae bacterium]|nr:glutathione S-transferase C-terminal domain-containing protein [Polyangiaceae bacterium]